MAHEKTIKITGKNVMDLDIRTTAINTLKDLPTEELDRLGTLARSETARNKFMSNWNMIKMMTGIK